MEERFNGDLIDWHGCDAVQFDPEKLSGKATLGDTRLDADTIIVNYESGMTVDELYEHFHADREGVLKIIAFYESSRMKLRA